jgi:malonyl-CoA/methylmalonyl-CoA synthetase
MTADANFYTSFTELLAGGDSPLAITDDGERVSYADAAQQAALLAGCLQALGARPGDRVTVQVEKSLPNLYLYLACLRAGLVYQPLNTAYRSAELRYFLENAEPVIVVCDPAGEDTVKPLLPRSVRQLLTLAVDGSGSLATAASEASPQPEPVERAGADLAALLYSSGTTGRPKGIMLTHDNLRSSAAVLVESWGFTASDRLLHALPIYHVHGLFVALGCVLQSGASMLWLNRFDVSQVIAALPECSVMMGVPTYYTRLLGSSEFNADHCSGMRLFISGSAPLLPETFDAFRERTGHTILERYGMTETSMNTSNPLHGERRRGTVGPALPGVELRVVDEQGASLPAGQPGDLQVKGANVFAGYWRLPEKTAEDFTDDGFFNTGDKASIDSDGYVTIVGRAKDMIITGGLNVYPREVELALDEMPGVTESAVIGVPDADFGEAVVAVVVGTDQAPDATAVIEQLREQLANFKVPKRVHFVESLPRNAMGKVQKNLLREQYGG